MSGLTGTDTPDQTLTLIELDASELAVLNNQATWTQAGKLVVALEEGDTHPMLAGTSYTFGFNVTNGFAAQASPVEVVVAPDLVISIYNMTDDMSVPHASLNIYNASAGDLRPLFVRTRTWHTKKIGQATVRTCPHTLVVFFRHF